MSSQVRLPPLRKSRSRKQRSTSTIETVPGCRLILGDCRDELAKLDPGSCHALVTDPPAGISFMGKVWDGDKGGSEQWINWLAELMCLALQALKPGAHGFVWALPRTSHWTARALELAGFEIRDCVQHVFGSGFPKSLNLPIAIDKAAGVTGPRGAAFSVAGDVRHLQSMEGKAGEHGQHEGITPEAQRWNGWGTALKPAAEFWWLVRKPLVGTVAANVLEHGTGGINVEGCRVPGPAWNRSTPTMQDIRGGQYASGTSARLPRDPQEMQSLGRWPPHLLLTHGIDCNDRRCARGCPVAEMDGQSGYLKTGHVASHSDRGMFDSGADVDYASNEEGGGASRFFPRFRYLPKPSRAEREAGCEHLPGRSGANAVDREKGSAAMDNPRTGAGRTSSVVHNHHPTLKGIDLMRWLVRLITPPGGVVLDPFMGSGTTGIACAAEGFDFVGIDEDPNYVQIARARIEHYAARRLEIENDEQERPEQVGQQDLW